MERSTYEMLARRQQTYWWHRARRALATALLQRLSAPRSGVWLDVGCGPAGNLSVAAAFAPRLIVGVDISHIALELIGAPPPVTSLVQADVSLSLPFQDGTCDVVTIFNVLYHEWIADERAVLREAARVLKRDGILLITEPAFAVLARQMDTAAMGRRRYRRADVVGMCRDAGFRVRYASYFTSFGFVVLGALKLMHVLTGWIFKRKAPPAADMIPISPVNNSMMYGLAAAEAALLGRGMRAPFGTTIMCVASNAS